MLSRKEKDRQSVLSSLCLAVITFFYFFVIGSILQLKIYTFQHRVTYGSSFSTHITTLNIDTIILISITVAWLYLSLKTKSAKALTMVCFSSLPILLFLNYNTFSFLGAGLTLPFITSLIIIDSLRNNNKFLRYDLQLSVNYIALISVALSLLGIASIIVFLSTEYITFTEEKYPYAIYQELLSVLTPTIMALLIFCIPVKIILNALTGKIKKIKSNKKTQNEFDKLPTRKFVTYISFSIFLGIVVALLPHLAVTNPYHERLGVDTSGYVQWLSVMQNQTSNWIPIAFKDLSSGDRPLTLIILYLIKVITKAQPFQVVEYFPVFLTPLLVVVTTFLTRQITGNDRITAIAAFLTAISFQTLAGIYSGFYANWLALIFGYLAFAFLIKFLKRPSRLTAASIAVSMSALVLAHVYTWTIIISVAFALLLILLVLDYFPRKRILLIYLVLSSSIAVDILKSSWTGSSMGFEADASLGRKGLGIGQFSERLKTLSDTVQIYYGGIYANIAILGLVFYWLIRCNQRDLASIFLLIFTSSASVPLFIGDWVLQSRVIYEIPFQIPAAIGLFFIWKDNQKLIFISIILVAAYLSFHVLVNLGLNYSVAR
jgi:hypothetical protein